MASYPAIVEWDENANAYGAVFPDLDVGAVGTTLEEVLENAEAMLRDYLMEMEKRGWPISEPSPLQGISMPTGDLLVSVSFALGTGGSR